MQQYTNTRRKKQEHFRPQAQEQETVATAVDTLNMAQNFVKGHTKCEHEERR